MTPKKTHITEPAHVNVNKRLFQCLPGDSLKRRVWCCLALHTGGFEIPVPMKFYRGNLIPLTQSNIAEELDLSGNNVHRCILELEEEGWLMREPIISGTSLTRGNVQLRVAADPVEPSET